MIKLDTSKVKYYVQIGSNHKNWYDHECSRLLELLPEFSHLPIIRVFAVTSMTTSMEANVSLAIRALLQMHKNEPFERFLPTQILYLNMIVNGMDVPGRKIMSFIRALEGDPEAVVVDIWMCRLFGIAKQRILKVNGKSRNYWLAPTKKEYLVVEKYCRWYAHKIGIEPRQLQAIMWSGIKKELSPLSTNVSWSTILERKKGFLPYI